MHQEKLLYFRDEVSCIQKVLHDQLERMRDIKTICWPLKSLRSSLNDQAILEECMRSTEGRIAAFEEMSSRSINIGIYVSSRDFSVFRFQRYVHSIQRFLIKFLEHPTHRSNERPPRSRHPRLHSRDDHLPSLILHFFPFRHEYKRHTKHG